MKATHIILLCIFSGICFSMKCAGKGWECFQFLKFTNGTGKPVYVLIGYDYPDTSINFQNPRYERYSHYIKADTREDINIGACMENLIEKSPGKKMSLFVFDAELLDTTSWSQIRQNYQVLRRMDYTLDELKNTHFSIDFP